MTAADCFGFLALLGREDRIQLPARTSDNRVYLGLNLTPDGPELPSSRIHDGIDADLLIAGKADLAGKPLPELPVSRRVPPWTVLEAWPAEHSRQEHQPVQGNPGQPAGEGHQQQHQGRKQTAAQTW